MARFRCIIMGAAGRDFHDFQTFFRVHPEFEVCCFTAHQIPFIERRRFPKELAGPGYTQDVPIYPEEMLTELIAKYEAEWVFLAYSDLAHVDVMHKASTALAAGANFALLGSRDTELPSRRKVLSVTAVRTGAGKSPLSQAITAHLRAKGKRVGVLRHPMPYGDLLRQAVQRFATLEDLAKHECTIEEREEYEPYVERGMVIWAGVDYASILKAAEEESDVILWDGGNNDTPFVKAGLRVVVLDALRPTHEVTYHPGEVNLRAADVLVINKVDAAKPEDVAAMRARCATHNPKATVIESSLSITVDRPELVKGKRALVVEDGPTLTHGGMNFGAGTVAAQRFGAGEVIDPRPYAVGSIAEMLAKYPNLGPLLPAIGYSDEQRAELVESIRRAKPEVILDASPSSLDRFLKLDIPVARVRYAFEQSAGTPLLELIDRYLES